MGMASCVMCTYAGTATHLLADAAQFAQSTQFTVRMAYSSHKDTLCTPCEYVTFYRSLFISYATVLVLVDVVFIWCSFTDVLTRP